MADNYLERRAEDYEKRKQRWLKKQSKWQALQKTKSDIK